jgi:hypothetical protein
MKNLFKLWDTGDYNRLYVFFTLDEANQFCDEFDRPHDLVGLKMDKKMEIKTMNDTKTNLKPQSQFNISNRRLQDYEIR